MSTAIQGIQWYDELQQARRVCLALVERKLRIQLALKDRPQFGNDPFWADVRKLFAAELLSIEKQYAPAKQRLLEIEAIKPKREVVPRQMWESVINFNGGKCHYCDAEATSVDHKRPVDKGGTNDPLNLVPCCKSCNSKKGTSDYETFIQKIANQL